MSTLNFAQSATESRVGSGPVTGGAPSGLCQQHPLKLFKGSLMRNTLPWSAPSGKMHYVFAFTINKSRSFSWKVMSRPKTYRRHVVTLHSLEMSFSSKQANKNYNYNNWDLFCYVHTNSFPHLRWVNLITPIISRHPKLIQPLIWGS